MWGALPLQPAGSSPARCRSGWAGRADRGPGRAWQRFERAFSCRVQSRVRCHDAAPSSHSSNRHPCDDRALAVVWSVDECVWPMPNTASSGARSARKSRSPNSGDLDHLDFSGSGRPALLAYLAHPLVGMPLTFQAQRHDSECPHPGSLLAATTLAGSSSTGVATPAGIVNEQMRAASSSSWRRLRNMDSLTDVGHGAP